MIKLHEVQAQNRGQTPLLQFGKTYAQKSAKKKQKY